VCGSRGFSNASYIRISCCFPCNIRVSFGSLVTSRVVPPALFISVRTGAVKENNDAFVLQRDSIRKSKTFLHAHHWAESQKESQKRLNLFVCLFADMKFHPRNVGASLRCRQHMDTLATFYFLCLLQSENYKSLRDQRSESLPICPDYEAAHLLALACV
jgi:hypothetical protein